MKNVYFVGASGTGKSTLADWVCEQYGMVQLPSAARQVAGEMGYGPDHFESLMADKDLYAEYQTNVAKRQVQLERDHRGPFVSCRAFDFVCYDAMYGRPGQACERTTNLSFVRYAAQLRSVALNVVFLVRPHLTINAKAKAQGGRRVYLNWYDVLQFDGMMKLLLEMYNVPYVEINLPEIDYRQAVISETLALRCMRPKAEVKDGDVGTV